MKPRVEYQWMSGKSYQALWDLQTEIHQALIVSKRLNSNDPNYKPRHRLLLCEHSPVYTLGKSGSMDHLLLDQDQLNNGDIEFFKINRGGDITYHGPGQITGYPILDLEEFYTDVHRYVRSLEECVIKTISEYGLVGSRVPSYTGVWLEPDHTNNRYRKICAIGVHLSRWVSMHGFALNVNTDLSYFKHIVPCGIIDEDKDVTSIAAEVGENVAMEEVADVFKKYFQEIFNCTIYDFERETS